MRTALIVLSALGLLAAGSAAVAREKLTGEAKLAKMLEGRVAGKPVSCINMTGSVDAQIIDKTAIVYGSGSTIYVNRPRHVDDLDDDDVMVTQMHSSQLCRLDTVRLHDRGTFMHSGFAFLEDFVPYRRETRAN